MRSGTRSPSRRTLAAMLAAAGAIGLLLPPAASAGIFTPEAGGSENADDISTLYEITLYIAVVIFAIVEGVLIWSLVRFRHRRDGPEAAQIRGNTPLEIGWTLGAAAILVLLTAITFVYLDDIEDPEAGGPGGLQAAEGVKYASVDQPPPPEGSRLHIGVNGQQYLWRYEYPEQDGKPLFAYYEMVVPVNTTVTLGITSQDVVHSWWIPKLGGKADAVPGHTNETWFKITRPGVYSGVCAELCGTNHAEMRARVRAVPVDEYERWAATRTADIQEAQTSLARQRKQMEASGELQ